MYFILKRLRVDKKNVKKDKYQSNLFAFFYISLIKSTLSK